MGGTVFNLNKKDTLFFKYGRWNVMSPVFGKAWCSLGVFQYCVCVVCCSRKEYRISGVCRLLPIALEGFGKDGGMALFWQALPLEGIYWK